MSSTKRVRNYRLRQEITKKVKIDDSNSLSYIDDLLLENENTSESEIENAMEEEDTCEDIDSEGGDNYFDFTDYLDDSMRRL